jgi:putrescine aminotransferase
MHISKLYAEHVNPSQIKLFSRFNFAKDLVESAEGCWIKLVDGKRILDLTGGIGVLNHGHNHPRILRARIDFQKRKEMEVHKNFLSPYIAGLCANIAEILPAPLQFSYFANSGAEAVEGAVKLAYKYHGGRRDYILHSNISFHGKLLGAGSLTNSPEINFQFPKIKNTLSFRYNDIEDTIQVINKIKKDGVSNVYALIIEPLNASSMQSCSETYLSRIREACNEHNIVLIFDEVYTGWAKTGFLFNFMRVPELTPDILVYAKSFGGGKSSISGYTYSKKVQSAYNNLKDVTLHSTTYYGFGEETVTAVEALNIIQDEDYVKKSQIIETLFKKELYDFFCKDNNFELRGSGALWGIVLKDSKVVALQEKLSKIKNFEGKFMGDSNLFRKILNSAIINYLYEKHKILTYFGSNIDCPLIISFPLVANKFEVDYSVKAIKDVLSKNLILLITKFVLKI